jgi:hypothetical protein
MLRQVKHHVQVLTHDVAVTNNLMKTPITRAFQTHQALIVANAADLE